ncbi:MAG: hypothetical protein WDA06_04600 [Phenylobacterium sp.]
MGILRNTKCYLSGPIQNAKDNGIGWRQQFIKLSEEKGLGVQCIDPTNKNNKGFDEIEEARSKLNTWKSKKMFYHFTKTMKKIRRWDLRAVDLSNFVIVYISSAISWGTTDEAITAERQNKPILAIVDGDIKNVPDWAFAVIDYKEMFESVEQCVNYLDRINRGLVNLDDRWVFI